MCGGSWSGIVAPGGSTKSPTEKPAEPPAPSASAGRGDSSARWTYRISRAADAVFARRGRTSSYGGGRGGRGASAASSAAGGGGGDGGGGAAASGVSQP